MTTQEDGLSREVREREREIAPGTTPRPLARANVLLFLEKTERSVCVLMTTMEEMGQILR